MSDFLQWASLGTAIVALIALAKFWMDVGATKRDAADALKKSEANAAFLSDFKATVAKEYASTQALAASETRLANAIEGMRADFRTAVGDMTGRIDRVLNVMQGIK